MPETIHTSPFQVETAARPSEKKSCAAKRIHEFQGFASGTVNVSTTNAPLPTPGVPRVVTDLAQSGGPPCVNPFGSVMRDERARNWENIGGSCDFPFQMTSLKAV